MVGNGIRLRLAPAALRVAPGAVGVGLAWVALACGPDTGPEAVPSYGTPALRAALADSLIMWTDRREAFSPVKEAALGIDPRETMRAHRQAVVDAQSDAELFYALSRMSNARWDRHLGVGLVPGGIEVEPNAGIEGSDAVVFEAPVRVLPDYGDTTLYFVADIASEASLYTDGAPAAGAVVRTVNGLPVLDYLEQIRPYHRASYRPNLRWRLAEAISLRTAEMPPDLYRDRLHLGLERPDGETVDVTLDYRHPDSIPWSGLMDPRYPGFEPVNSTPTYDLYVHGGGRSVLVLTWYGFRETMIQDVDQLMALAVERGWLNYDVIFDGTRSRGGSAGPYAVQRLTPKPFKTTFGNLRISDVVPSFIEEKEREISSTGALDSGVSETMDDGTWLMDWLRGAVSDSVAAGAAYTNDVPFKLAHASEESDGVLEPAERHFSGRMVAFFLPRRGSHLDQVAAIIKDNDLGHIIGMTAGGYSNTWEWEETVRFPGTDRPVVLFMWDIGHTIRPNGEILEGNPALPDEEVILTRLNFSDYYPDLTRRALRHLGYR